MSNVSPSSDTIALQNYYNRAYRELEEAKNQDLRREKAQHSKDLERLENNYNKTLNQKEIDTSELTENIRKETAAANAVDRQRARETIDQLQRDSYNSRGALASAIPLAQHKREIQELVNNADRNEAMERANRQHMEEIFSHKLDDAHKQASTDLREAHDKHSEQLSQNEANAKQRLKTEKEENEQKLKELKNSVLIEQKNQKGETRRVEEAYSNYLDELKKNLGEKDEHYSDRLRETLKEKDHFLADTIAKQNLENRASLEDLSKIYSTQIDQLNQEKKLQDQVAADRLQSSTQDDHDRLAATMKKQAEIHELDRQHLSDLEQARYQHLEDEFKKKTHLTRTDDVPAVLEQKIHDAVVNQYEKKLSAEQERNQSNHAKLAESYGSKYRQALETAADRETRLHQENELEKTRERTTFFETLTNSQEQAEAKSRDKDAFYQLQFDKLQRKFAYALERQKHEYETIIDGIKAEADSKLVETREQDTRQSRMVMKNINEKQSEILREYDRRLSEQREQYGYMIDDLKTQMKSEFHDLERRSKQELEVQSKSYEQKIAQLEEQNKEHERYLAQVYEEQLAKLRKSYELTSQQKKS